MIRTIQSPWVTALVGCLLYLAVTMAVIKPSHFAGFQRPSLTQGGGASAADDPSWKFRNPELDQWINETKREKEALALREQQLHELQVRLETERQELNSVTQLVYQLQTEFDKNVLRITEQEAVNLKRQAKVFSGMSPDAVASLVRDMSEDTAARTLFFMKAEEVSAILETLGKRGPAEARRAAAISDRTRKALPPASTAQPRTPS